MTGGKNWAARRIKSDWREVPVFSNTLAIWVRTVVIAVPMVLAVSAGVRPASSEPSTRVSADVKPNSDANDSAGIAVRISDVTNRAALARNAMRLPRLPPASGST